MRRRTHRYIAWLCVFCMLMTSMPYSVMSDSVPATPTDLQQPVPEETKAPEPAAPEAEPADPEPADPEPSEPGTETQEPKEKEPAKPEQKPDKPEPEKPAAEKPAKEEKQKEEKRRTGQRDPGRNNGNIPGRGSSFRCDGRSQERTAGDGDRR